MKHLLDLMVYGSWEEIQSDISDSMLFKVKKDVDYFQISVTQNEVKDMKSALVGSIPQWKDDGRVSEVQVSTELSSHESHNSTLSL